MKINDTNLLYKIKKITCESDITCNQILSHLNKLNPSHEYHNDEGTAKIMFFKGNDKIQVLKLNHSYQDLEMIYDHIFKRKIILKNASVKTDNYIGKIIIDDKLLTKPAFMNLNLTRYNAIKTIQKMIAEKLSVPLDEIQFIGNIRYTEICFLYNNKEIIINPDENKLKIYVEI